MSNQASEDNRIIEDNDRIYQGLACLHKQRHLKDGCFCTSEISGVYRIILDEVNELVRTEKLKLLAEVRKQVVGEDNERLSGNRAIKHEWNGKNELRAEQRTALNKLEAEL